MDIGIWIAVFAGMAVSSHQVRSFAQHSVGRFPEIDAQLDEF